MVFHAQGLLALKWRAAAALASSRSSAADAVVQVAFGFRERVAKAARAVSRRRRFAVELAVFFRIGFTIVCRERAADGKALSSQFVCYQHHECFYFHIFISFHASRFVGLEVRRSRSPPEFGVNIFIIRLVMVHIRRRLRKSWTRLALRSDVRGGYNARRR